MRVKRRGVWKLLALLTVFSLFLAACGSDDDGDKNESGSGETETTTGDQKSGGTVILAAEQEPESLNWLTAAHNTAWGSYVMGWVWPGTYIADPSGKIVRNKDLVTSVELTKEEPQTVVYKINPKAKWSDGQDITADDFIYYWQAQNGKDESYLPAGTTGYEDIDKVEGSDNGKTVTVTFAKKFADWETLFDYLLPAHAFKAAGGGDPVKGFNEGYVTENLKLDTVISGGPFKVTAFTKGQSMTLEKNADYWGTPAFLDKIVIPFITDGTQQPAALENKEADVAFPQAQLDLVQQVKGIQGITSEIGFGTFWEHIDFNEENPNLAVKEVRQAIAKAIDRQEIVKRLPGQFSDKAEVLDNRIYKPSQDDYKANGEKEYGKRDVAAAKKLLESAGYTAGPDGVYAKGGQKLSIRITWRDPNPRRQQTAQLLQAQMKEAGIDAQLAPQPDFTFLDEGNFDIALFGWTGGVALSSNTSIYRSDGGQNYSKNKNPEIDKKLDAANVELDADKRADLMNEVDMLLWEDMPTVPLFQVPELLAYRDTVVGPKYNGFQGPTWNANRWSLK